MEFDYTFILNEEVIKGIGEQKKSVYIFGWLRFLDKNIASAPKADLKANQEKLVSQLLEVVHDCPGPPTRKLVARCLATLFSIGDTFLLFDTVNQCNDILKNKDDSPTFVRTKMSAICCIGVMYEKLGRMMGPPNEKTVQILIKSLSNADSLTRIEVMFTFEKIYCGMGAAISITSKEMYKLTKSYLNDRVMAVRFAAAKCLLEMMKYTPSMYTTELENMASMCLRACDGVSYETRYSIAKLLGTLISATQQSPLLSSPGIPVSKNSKELSIDDALNILMSGFLRGGTGFLKGTGGIIKGSSTVNREVRIAVTHAYVMFVQIQGGVWLERNMVSILNHVLELVANPKAASSHIDAVYSRKCINLILRSTLGRMLREKAQELACKQLIGMVAKQMASIDFNPENAKDNNQETIFGQHLLVCALQEMGLLILTLGTTSANIVNDPSCALIETVLSVLIHPCFAARLAAAYCLRCICIANPSQCTFLINRCLEGLENTKATSEGISGFSGALAAVLGCVRFSPLGIPHTKGKVIFNTAEELLRSANQNSRLSLHRTQAGWLLIGSIMTLKGAVVRSLLPRMVLLWRNSFPRSNKELESEKARGDAFTWQVTLEGRAGALSSIYSFLLHCPDLVNEDIIRRLLTPIESAISMLINIGSVMKSYNQHIKAPTATVRHRLYETLALIPPHCFEGSYTHLLRLLVSEFTLSENPANTNCSILRTNCQTDDSILLGTSSLIHNDHRIVEDQLQSYSAAGSGAFEHDPCCLYRLSSCSSDELPGPLPLGIAVIDSSITLFGLIFPRVANKHRLQILEHFIECIRNSKSSRADAVTMNAFAALLAALKGLTDSKEIIGQDDVRKAATMFIGSNLTANNPQIRVAAAESLGRLAQIVGDPHFTAELAQTSFDKLKSAPDIASRTGHSLALGCIHRFVGGMGSSQHLNTSVSILLALAQDVTCPEVQTWSLYALSLMAESAGPMFRGYIDPTLSLTLKLLLSVSLSNVGVYHSIGKVLSALITVIGPELQSNSSNINNARGTFLCACDIMQDHHDPLVQAEATACTQQLHLFAPKFVNLSSFVPTLCKNLASNHLSLRKAVVSCLRQLTQREAKEVSEHALSLVNQSEDTCCMSERGLPGLLFRMLDTETDRQMVNDIHDTISSMLQILSADNLSQWLSLCKSVLTVTDQASGENDANGNDSTENGNESDEEEDDLADFKDKATNEHKKAIQPRWPTRVFAAECIRRIIVTCQLAHPAHFDIQLAKELQISQNKGDYLVLHLSELIRMAFIAATSDSDELRLEGLSTLHLIIEKFCKVPEPEFPGHLLLEQFQAQVGAALRPAFSSETTSNVTAAACAVCSAWIGSGVAKDLNDLRRVHQLLVSSLTKLKNTSNATTMYNESITTLEKLSILKAWAEVYIVAMKNEECDSSCITNSNDALTEMRVQCGDSDDDDFGDFTTGINGSNSSSRQESLLTLVQPQLKILAEYWLAALKDHALLMLPAEYSSQLPRDGGTFYTNETMDSCRPHYCVTWPSLLHAATIWLTSNFFSENDNTEVLLKEKDSSDATEITANKRGFEYFGLIFGLCMEALCNSRSACTTEEVITCLCTLKILLSLPYPRNMLTDNTKLPIEVCNVMHRLLLTHDILKIQKLCMDVLKLTITAAQERLTNLKNIKRQELTCNKTNSNAAHISITESTLDTLGEGGENDEINHEKSFVFAVLEVCLCLLVKLLPNLNPSSTSTVITIQIMKQQIISEDELSDLISQVISSMEHLPDLCSPTGAISILPTILYLLTNVLKEMASKCKSNENNIVKTQNSAVASALRALKMLVTHKYCLDTASSEQWKLLLQSTLAKLIDFVKTGSEEIKINEMSMMLALSVFVLNAPSDVVIIPNLQYPCINYFQLCFQSEDIQVKTKCVQTLKWLFNHPDKSVAGGYILALAPRLIEYLHLETTKIPYSDEELQLTVEIINTVESLIRLAEPGKGIKVLSMLVQALINLLQDNTDSKQITKYQISLHEYSLQWLTKIGPQYPEDFKTVVNKDTEMRSKLEVAIRAKAQKSTTVRAPIVKIPSINAAPTIKLKMDFTNYKA